jgi:hypothetical protein
MDTVDDVDNSAMTNDVPAPQPEAAEANVESQTGVVDEVTFAQIFEKLP